MTVCVDVPAPQVWALLADLERIADWAPGIRSARCPLGRESGLGALRECQLTGGIELIENWTDWVDGVSFTYEGSGLPGVQLARNTWSVQPIGDAQALLRSDAEVELRGRVRGGLFGGVLRWQARRAGARSLGAFKYLVETGSAPATRRRYPAPATC